MTSGVLLQRRGQRNADATVTAPESERIGANHSSMASASSRPASAPAQVVTSGPQRGNHALEPMKAPISGKETVRNGFTVLPPAADTFPTAEKTPTTPRPPTAEAATRPDSTQPARQNRRSRPNLPRTTSATRKWSAESVYRLPRRRTTRQNAWNEMRGYGDDDLDAKPNVTGKTGTNDLPTADRPARRALRKSRVPRRRQRPRHHLGRAQRPREQGASLARAGFEPACPEGQGILSPQRLPIPPPGRLLFSRTYVTRAAHRQSRGHILGSAPTHHALLANRSIARRWASETSPL